MDLAEVCFLWFESSWRNGASLSVAFGMVDLAWEGASGSAGRCCELLRLWTTESWMVPVLGIVHGKHDLFAMEPWQLV